MESKCKICERETKYGCSSCGDRVCVVCSESSEGEIGYNEENHRVGKCPQGKCNRSGSSNNDNEKTTNNKKRKPSSILSFFPARISSKSQAKTKSDGPKHDDTLFQPQNTVEPTKSSVLKRTNPDSCGADIISAKESKIVKHDDKAAENIITHFQKIFPELDPNEIHNFHVCHQRSCHEISSTDLSSMTKDKKFQHKWLFDPQHAYCAQTNTWNLVYIDGKGMFCSSCREFDTKQPKNGGKQWNSTSNVRYRTETIKGHFTSRMHLEAAAAKKRLSSSFFDATEKKRVESLKNDVYFKVFQGLYWIAKEEIASTKITSLLTLLQKLGVQEISHFTTRSEPVLRKMLLLISKVIIEDLVTKIKESDVYGLLTDEVTDIANVCQLVSFIKYFDLEKGQSETKFIDCSDLLNFSPTSSPDADAIVACIAASFEELTLNIKNLQAFASDGASVMVGEIGGVAAKLRKDFIPTMINIHCICHRLALACGDTGDDYKFIQNIEENILSLWAFFKNSSKRLHIYIKIALKSKQFDTLTPKRRKAIVKRMKKACRTRWLSLHAGVDAAWEEFPGLIAALKHLQSDRASGPKATGILSKINNYEFLGTLCLLKNMLPILSTLSKTFQIGSLNFSRIKPSISRTKVKINDVERDGRVLRQLKTELSGRFSALEIELTEFQEMRIKSFVTKYASSICKNIDNRFPKETCDALDAFSIFDLELLPPSSSNPMFAVHGIDEITVLSKQFLPNELESKVQSEWEDFKYDLLETRKKLFSLKKQIEENKLRFKKTSCEWLISHILNSYKNNDYPLIVRLARIASIIPVTNAWPERGASAVKRIKDRMRSSMKNDLLNGLLHISMNGPPVNSKEADSLISRVVDRYVHENHYKVPTIYSTVATTMSTMTQTDVSAENEATYETSEVLQIDSFEHELIISYENEEYMKTNAYEESSCSEDDDQ